MKIHYKRLWSVALAILLTCFSLSCSSSEDDEENGRKNEVSSPMDVKHIVREYYKEGNNDIYYGYDSQGRVISELVYEYGRLDETITYTYNSSSIIMEEKYPSGETKTKTFTLNEGRIIKDDEYTYIYSVDGHIRTQSYKYGIYNYLWTNENLTGMEKNGYLSRNWRYSKIPWPKNFFFYFKGSNWEPELELAGAYGKMPKYLPECFTYSTGDGWTFEYTIESGLITKVIFRNFNENGEFDGSFEEMVVEWE